MQKVASHHVSQYLTLPRLSLSLNLLQLLVVTWANPLSWYLSFHTEYSIVITTQLNMGTTCSAMLYTNLNMLQSGEVELDPAGGKIRLYNGYVVEPLGSYTFTVSLNSGSECKTSFGIMENAPWPIINGNTRIKQGSISLGLECQQSASISNQTDE